MCIHPPMSTDLVAAIDQGTQSTRVYMFDKDFQPVSFYQVNFTQIYPQAGWVEHDPLEIWSTVKECIAKALQEATEKLGPVNIRGVGLTNQRETTVVWHKTTGQPLYNAIVWSDSRTRDICKALEEKLGGPDYFRPITGLPISTYFSAFKFKWMYENVEAVKRAVDDDLACFGTMDSWLIYCLTGGSSGGIHVTDVTNASRTFLMDIHALEWHEPSFEFFDIKPSVLPTIKSSSEVYGTIAEGPLAGVPVAGCLGDQMSAVLGQRCTEGEAKCTYGTGCFLLFNTGSKVIRSRHGLLSTIAYKLGPKAEPNYALEGAVAVAGLGISWLRDNLNIIADPSEAEQLAASVPDTGGVYFVPAFSGLLAPHWEQTARGTIVGLTGFSTRAHIVRAMLEAICFQNRELLDAMNRDAELEGMKLLRVDGGASKNALLMQLQADFLQLPVVRPNFNETTSLGAALAAGLAVGMYTEEQVFASQAYNTAEFTPKMSHEETEKRYAHWKKAVDRSRDTADLADV